MNSTIYSEQRQVDEVRTLGIINGFFRRFNFGTMLNRSNISKTKGASPLSLFTIIFKLAFDGKNFFQGIVENDQIAFGKDTFYQFLNNPNYNWRKMGYLAAVKIYVFFKSLLNDSSEEVLIFDDSPYDRNRSKKVELLAKVYDHTLHKYLKGFRMLTLGWSDGNSFLGLDFAILSSPKKENRYQEITKSLDRRTCGYIRRKEALTKSTELLEPMVKRALSLGVKAKYLLMDSWFSFPALIATLRKHIHVICMLKDQPTVLYQYKGKRLRLSELYAKIKKRRGRAKIKARVIISTNDGQKVKIVFVSTDNKRGWLALLSTDLSLDDTEIVRLYGKRWDIEVFFKMAKQHLKLVKEIQLRDFDGLIAHSTIVMMRYNFLSYEQRLQVDERTCGSLFRACCEELSNLTFIEALQRIMALAMQMVRKTYQLSENVIQTMIDTVMGAAIRFFNLEACSCQIN